MTSRSQGSSGEELQFAPPPPPRNSQPLASPPRAERSMQLAQLLNDPLPPMRSSTPLEPVRSSGSTSSRLPSLAAVTDDSFAPPAQPLAGFAPPPPSSSSTGPKRPPTKSESSSFCESTLYCDSRQTIEVALETFRRNAHNVPDFARAGGGAIAAVTEAFKAFDFHPEIVTTNPLWAVWNYITELAKLANVPTFPIDPDKVALLLSVYVNLPCSRIVRGLMQHRYPPLRPDTVIVVIEGLNVAGKASKDFFPRSTSFVRSLEEYPSTNLVATLCGYKPPTRAPAAGFAPPKPPSRPSLSKFQPIPSSRFNAGPPAPPPKGAPIKRTLRELCLQLPSILRDLQKLPDDPKVFDVAQIRFQNASSAPAYVTRMPDLVQAAIIYTDITALLCFPTYPIDAVKLSVFGLAFTPGPLGQLLVAASPDFARQQHFARKSPKEMEKLMKDVTSVRDITRGGSVAITEAETRDWQDWLKELTLDWKSVEPPETSRSRPSQSGGPPRKRAKLSPSPSNSDVARESAKSLTSRPTLGSSSSSASTQRSKPKLTKPANLIPLPPPSDRSTPTPSDAASDSSSLASTATSTTLTKDTTAPKSKGRKKSAAPRPSTKTSQAMSETGSSKSSKSSKSRKDAPSSSATSSTSSRSNSSKTTVVAAPPLKPAPRWVPEVHGKIPDEIPPPPLPMIRPSPRWLKKQQALTAGEEETGDAGSTGGDQDDEGDEEPVPTIATSRPKRVRGGFQMIPVDIEALCEIARSVGYTQDAWDEAFSS